jgi:hypothetical protein
MRKLLTLAIPLLLGVGILTALVSNPDSGKQSKQSQAGVAASESRPAVIEEAAAPATTAPTTPTTAPASTTTTLAPATTTTTAAPATTTTTRPKAITAAQPRVTPTTAATAPQPQPTQAAQPQVIDCGTGTASAKANLVAGSAPGTNALTATVDNESTKTIELDSLVVTVDYNDGTQKQFTLQVAGQQVAARPGQNTLTLQVPNSQTASSGPSSIKNFVISNFQFHTAGLPECTSH